MPAENFIALEEVVAWAAAKGYLQGWGGSFDVETEYLSTLGLSPSKYRLEASPNCLGWFIERRSPIPEPEAA